MPDRPTLPDWPRVMPEPLAAAYIGLSSSTFRAQVMSQIPAVRLTDKRQGWDRRALDAWVDRKAGQTAPSPQDQDEDGREWLEAFEAPPPHA